MDLRDIKEKIKIAKKAVEGEEEPYKTEAFKIIFSKLLESNNTPTETERKKSSTITKTQTIKKVSGDLDDKKQELAKQCGIDVIELDDVLYFKDNLIKIVAPLSGAEPENQVTVVKCILTAYAVIFEQTWVKSLVLSKCVRLSKVGQLKHLAENLNKDKQSFRVQGIRRSTEYKITESGKNSAYEIIRKLAKGEKL